MTLRKIHRILGLCFAPFFLLTAATGALLLWRKDDLYSHETQSTLLKLHNCEGLHAIGIHYMGMILAAALILMVLTGWCIALQMRARKRKGT